MVVGPRRPAMHPTALLGAREQRHVRHASVADSSADRKRKGCGLHPATGRGSLCRAMERRPRAVQESREACSTPPMSAALLPPTTSFMRANGASRPHTHWSRRGADRRLHHPATLDCGLNGVLWSLADRTYVARRNRTGDRFVPGRLSGHRLPRMAALCLGRARAGRVAPPRQPRYIRCPPRRASGVAHRLVESLRGQGHLLEGWDMLHRVRAS